MKALITNNLTGITTEVEVEEMPIIEVQQPEPQPTLEEKVTELQNVIVELTTILNDKGIAP